MAGKVQLAEMTAEDLPEVAAFHAAETGRPTARDAVAARTELLRWYLLDGPARTPGVPPGWVVRDSDGRLVGSKWCVPQRFRCGEATFTLLLGGGFYVNRAHRGIGLLLLRRFLDLGSRHALFAATMNEVSGALYERMGGYPIAGTDHELLGIQGYRPVVEEWLARRIGGGLLARAVALPAGLRPAALRPRQAGRLERVEDPVALRGLEIDVPRAHADQLTALRDEPFLRWRYFERRDPSAALYVFEPESGGRVLVAVDQRPRGWRSQVRALRVLDWWGEAPAAAVVETAQTLAHRYRHATDLLVFRAQPPDRERLLREAGFVRRDLTRAEGVCIDRAGLLPTRAWYLVPADGDMSL